MGGILTRNVACADAGNKPVVQQKSKEATVSYRPVARRLKGGSAGITLKSAPRIGVGDRLHQLGDLGLQIFVGHDQRADGRSHIAAAGRDRLIHRGFQPVSSPSAFGCGEEDMALFPGAISGVCGGGICSYFVLIKSTAVFLCFSAHRLYARTRTRHKILLDVKTNAVTRFPLVAALLLIVLPASQSRAASPTVRDGGTLQLGNMTYRLDGIDAPPVDQLCIDEHADSWTCGIEARDQLTKLIAGRQVRCDDLGIDPSYKKRHLGVCKIEGEPPA